MNTYEKKDIAQELSIEGHRKKSGSRFFKTKREQLTGGLDYLVNAFLPITGDVLVFDVTKKISDGKKLTFREKFEYTSFVVGKYGLYTLGLYNLLK